MRKFAVDVNPGSVLSIKRVVTTHCGSEKQFCCITILESPVRLKASI